MGFLKKMLEKIAGEPSEEPFAPLAAPAENPAEQPAVSLPQTVPMLLSPLALSVQELVKKNLIPADLVALNQALAALPAKKDLALPDLAAFAAQVQGEMAHQEEQLLLLSGDLEKAGDMKAAMDYLKRLIGEVEQLTTPLPQEEMGYEQMSASKTMARFRSLGHLLGEMEESGGQLGLEATLRSSLTAFLASYRPIAAQQEGAVAQAEQLAGRAESLREEIQKFSQALSKIKSMGPGAMEQYYESLTTAQQDLNGKRADFVAEEDKINKFIQIVYQSAAHTLTAFAEYLPPLATQLNKSLATLEESYNRLTGKGSVMEQAAACRARIRGLEGLLQELEQCGELHKRFL